MNKFSRARFKQLIYALLLLELVFSYTPAAYAQTADFNYASSSISSQIEKYLCAPSPVDKSQTELHLDSQSNQFTFNQNLVAAKNKNSQDLFNCINKLYKFAIIIAAVLGVFFIVIAGYVYMSADGNQESVDKAKSIFTSTLTSLVILFAGYILLKAINPDLVQFKSIQPPSVVLPKATMPVTGAGTVSNSVAADLIGSGCAFQTDKQKIEASQMAPQLVSIAKNICYNVAHNYPNTNARPATISSVIGMDQHAENSYHYKGCALDFADGGGVGFFNFSDKTGRPVGVAIYKEALANGISIDRIDPGTDRDASKSYMLHIDLGSNCPN